MSKGNIAQLGATGVGGFFGGPAGAAAANAAVGGLRGKDLKQIVFEAGLSAGATGIGKSLFGGEELVNAGQSAGSFDALGVPTTAAGEAASGFAGFTPAPGGPPIGSFDVLGSPTGPPTIGGSPAGGFSKSFLDRRFPSAAAPSAFDVLQKRATQANTIGTSAVLGQQLFQPPQRPQLPQRVSGPFQPAAPVAPPSFAQFQPRSLLRSRSLFG